MNKVANCTKQTVKTLTSQLFDLGIHGSLPKQTVKTLISQLFDLGIHGSLQNQNSLLVLYQCKC